MLIRMRNTSTLRGPLGHRRIQAIPPCSMVGKWKQAVLAMACRKFGIESVSASVRGIAVCWPFGQIRNGLRKNEAGIEIGVMVAAAIPRVPAGIQR